MLRKVAFGFVLVSISVPMLGGRAAANVLVVDPGGGGNFTTIQAAITAAQSGDTILVRTGAYAGFTVPDAALSIVADDGAQVSISGTVSITGLSASHTIVLAGLRITAPNAPPSATPVPALWVTNVAGPVRVQGCTLTGAPGCNTDGGTTAAPGAQITGGSTRVAFVNCTLRGGDGGQCDFCDLMPPGGAGLYVVASRVALYDCTLTGGNGGFTSAGFSGTPEGGRGGDGAYDWEGFVHASNSTLTGGDGGYVLDCKFGGPTDGGDGGDGLNLLGPNPLPAAWSIGSTFQPGAGSPHMGAGGCDESLAGAPGEAVRTQSGSYFPLSGARLEMDAPALVREGHDLALTVRGQPGTIVEVVFARATQFTAIPSLHGVVLTKNTQGLHPSLYLGEIPASGVITDGITVGDLPAGVASGQFFLQARSRGQSRVLGSFAALTVVDSAY